MFVSLFLGPNVTGPEQDHRAIDLCIEQALIADAAGFAAVYVGEQHFNNYEPYSNPIVMAAYLAGQFRQAYLGTSMIPLPMHHPLELVERVNLLDQLTRGRCIIGLSSGRPGPNRAFPIDYPAGGREQLFDEKIDVMQRAWAHDAAAGPMSFGTSAESGVMERMMPISYRAGHPLFAIGTSTESKIAAAGRAGQMVHTAGGDVASTARLLELYLTSMREGGCSSLTIEANLDWFIHTKVVFVGETDSAAADAAEAGLIQRQLPPWVRRTPEQEGMGLAELLSCDPGPTPAHFGSPETLAGFLQRTSIVGSPESVATQLTAFSEAGLRHLHARFAFGSLADVEPFQRSLRLFVDEVMPRVGTQTMPDVQPEQVRPECR